MLCNDRERICATHVHVVTDSSSDAHVLLPQLLRKLCWRGTLDCPLLAHAGTTLIVIVLLLLATEMKSNT